MKVEIALCQLEPVPGKPSENAARVGALLREGAGDMLMLPELYLTGYGTPCGDMQEEVEMCIGELSDLCRMTDRAVAIGAPRYDNGVVYNSLFFLSPDGDSCYDKAHLASFGVYAETGFEQGSGPAMGSYHGMLFGMCVCYDIFFPEILHGCSLNGASVNICCAASAVQSKPLLDRVLPARALEDVTYTAYINNTGVMNGLTMHGCSRGLDPLGETLASCGEGEGVARFSVDTESLAEAREIRRHLADFRSEVDWGIQSF